MIQFPAVFLGTFFVIHLVSTSSAAACNLPFVNLITLIFRQQVRTEWLQVVGQYRSASTGELLGQVLQLFVHLPPNTRST